MGGRILTCELGLRGLEASRQVPFLVYYRGGCVGEYLADMVVDGRLIVELKCVESFAPEHLTQVSHQIRVDSRPSAAENGFS